MFRLLTDKFPLILSLFPHVPPYIKFLPLNQEYDPPQPQVSAMEELVMTLMQGLEQMSWNAPGEAVPIVVDCVKKAGYCIAQHQVR